MNRHGDEIGRRGRLLGIFSHLCLEEVRAQAALQSKLLEDPWRVHLRQHNRDHDCLQFRCSSVRDGHSRLPTRIGAQKYLRSNPDDYQYLNFLKWKYHHFSDIYPREMLMFKDFMKEENFVQWYSDHPQYNFDKGQAPRAEDFSSKKVYEDLMAEVSKWEYRNEDRGRSI